MIRSVITEDQAKKAIADGDFGEDILQAAEYVVVVLTQGWCPQWSDLKRTLKKLEEDQSAGNTELHVFELVYDAVPYSSEFMRFKEQIFGNSQIPYVRYYKNGVLTGESNWVTRKKFLKKVGAHDLHQD